MNFQLFIYICFLQRSSKSIAITTFVPNRYMSHSSIHGSRNIQRETAPNGTHANKVVDEEVLIQRVFERDPRQGCEILFQKYYKALCSHAIRFVYSREVAEDIVSEIFCRFWTDQTYNGITTSYRAYLFKAVRFSAYNYIKWELSKKRNEVDFEIALETMNSFDAGESILFDELSDEISRIIENLPAQCKRVFMLSRFENMKYAQIAATLSISVKMVEAHVSKALHILRDQLKNQDLLSFLIIASFLRF
jgi:RNA polymerase sigma-70 factor (family 1)